MLPYKICLLFVAISIHSLTVRAVDRISKNGKRFNFHATQTIDDLVRNPSALNRDELSEIDKLDRMNDMFMNPEVTSETQDLSRQGLDPDVAMQISKIDQNLGETFGARRANQQSTAAAKQKGEILPGYGEQYNADGSISLSSNEWPEYQLQDTPPMMNMHRQGLNSMLLGNGDVNGLRPMNNAPQVSPQAALNPNLLPGQKSDLGLGMGVGMDKFPIAPMMSRFVDDVANGKSMNKQLLNAPFKEPGIKSAGFRIPGEFSFKGERKSGENEEEANFVKNFMSSKKSRAERKKAARKLKQ